MEWKRHWVRYIQKMTIFELRQYGFDDRDNAHTQLQTFFDTIPSADGDSPEALPHPVWPPEFLVYKPPSQSQSQTKAPQPPTIQKPAFVQVTSSGGVTQKELQTNDPNSLMHIPPKLLNDHYYLVDSGGETASRIHVAMIVSAANDARGHLYSVPEQIPDDEPKHVMIQWLYRCKQDKAKDPWESRWMPLLKKKDIKKSIEKWSTSEIGPEIKLSKQKGSGRGYVLKGSIEIFKQLSTEIESM
jgi:hypothetical protein